MHFFIVIFYLITPKFVACFTDFPSLMIANATMVIVIEKPFYGRKILIKETSNPTSDAYEKSVATFTSAVTKIARERMNMSGLSIILSQDTEINLARDYTILLSVATCSSTWDLFYRATQEKLVHLALTDLNCPRLPADGGISIPLVDPGEELPQIFYDFKISQHLKWNRANIIHDDILDKDEIGHMLKGFTNELPQSTIGLASNYLFFIKKASSATITKYRIRKVLSNFPHTRPIDEQFFAVISYQTISPFLEVARSLKMLHPKSQWLFVIPDMATYSYSDVSFLRDLLEEGENIAFLYNNTNPDVKNQETEKCHITAVCYAKEIVSALGIALEKALSVEIELFDKVTEEEFEATGITKLVRSKHIVTYIRDELYNDTKSQGRSSTCGRCMMWIIVSALTWGNKIGPEIDYKPHELKEIAIWTPDAGFKFVDYIFPHAVYGFLEKALPIVTYHNPPWQFEVTKQQGDTNLSYGKQMRWDGFIFEIVKELSSSLNFTVKIVVVESPPEIVLTKNVNVSHFYYPVLHRDRYDLYKLRKPKKNWH